jgi:branched-chain amino acid aminotransferase
MASTSASSSTSPAWTRREPRTTVVHPAAPAAVSAAPAPPAAAPAFGTEFAPLMAVSRFDGSSWTAPVLCPLESLQLHPGTHALHYGSACFEGLKAHRQPDGSVRAFRARDHVARLRQSAGRLCLPVPDTALAARAIALTLDAAADVTPDAPGALYLRPTLLGADASIGAAAHPSRSAVFYVLACPVGDYLPPRPLTIAVETSTPRTTPQFGVVKAGANYAMALPVVEAARRDHGADQVVFARSGVIEETGASNIVLIDGQTIVTPALTDGFLHGVTRDSLLRLARDVGWSVEERTVTVDELVAHAGRPHGEVALTGTAAVVAPVGTLVVDGRRIPVGDPSAPRATELRDRLIAVQTGREPADWR